VPFFDTKRELNSGRPPAFFGAGAAKALFISGSAPADRDFQFNTASFFAQ